VGHLARLIGHQAVAAAETAGRPFEQRQSLAPEVDPPLGGLSPVSLMSMVVLAAADREET